MREIRHGQPNVGLPPRRRPLRPGERLVGDRVLFSSAWLDDAHAATSEELGGRGRPRLGVSQQRGAAG